MPKKKRKTAGGPNSQALGEEESRGPLKAKLKHSFVDTCIVISDSDGEVSGK